MFSIIIAYKNKEYKTVSFVKLGLDGNETAMSYIVFFFFFFFFECCKELSFFEKIGYPRFKAIVKNIIFVLTIYLQVYMLKLANLS